MHLVSLVEYSDPSFLFLPTFAATPPHPHLQTGRGDWKQLSLESEDQSSVRYPK